MTTDESDAQRAAEIAKGIYPELANKVYVNNIQGDAAAIAIITAAIDEAVVWSGVERDKFQEAFLRFGRHRDSCDWSHNKNSDCSCGYVEAISHADYNTQRDEVEAKNQKLHSTVGRLHDEADALHAELANTMKQRDQYKEMLDELHLAIESPEEALAILERRNEINADIEALPSTDSGSTGDKENKS